MKSTAEKSSATTTPTTVQEKPFFSKQGEEGFFAPTAVQAKLKINAPGDKFEKEADTMADQVVRHTEAPKTADWREKDKLQRQPLARNVTPLIQRKQEDDNDQMEEAEEVQRKEQSPMHDKPGLEKEQDTPQIQRKEQEESVQTKRTGDRVVSLPQSVETTLRETKGYGAPLSPELKQRMGFAFGADFSQVRIHTGSAAVTMSSELNAQAFTHGNDIYFNEGAYNPATTEGKTLIAHELTHTIQQGSSVADPQSGDSETQAAAPQIPVAQSAQPAVPTESVAAPETPDITVPETAAEAPVAAPGQDAPAEAGTEAPAAEGEQAAIPKAPTTPKEDPAFQEAKKQVHSDGRKQKKHEPKEQKQAEMVGAAALQEGEQREQSSEELRTAQLEAAAQPHVRFDAVGFKAKLKAKIEEKLPKTEDEAKAFSGSGKLDEAKEEFSTTVGEEKKKVTGPLETTTVAPAPAGQVSKTEVPVPAPKPADQPSSVPPGLAIPKPRTDQEISLQKESDNLDQRLVDEHITEQQLAESEEPQFEQALQKKQDAQREIAAAPARYRVQETQVLQQAEQQSDKTTGKGLKGMSTVKNDAVTGVHGGQKLKESDTEKRQREIKDTINGIYTSTETDVNLILENLSKSVEIKFNTEVMVANMLFRMSVNGRLDDYYGYFTFDDKIAEAVGLSDGVAHIFREEKQNFLDRMDVTLDGIAVMVERELNAALARIQKGRTDLENFKKTLSADEQTFAADLLSEVGDKFTELESTVEAREEELIDTLSDQYVEHVGKLQEEFDKINEELGSSWIADAISFIGDVAQAIRRLGALLMSIVDRISNAIDGILAAPKKFFNTLVSGITQGMDNFTSKIDTYLEQGFWMWLTGSTGARNIQIPEKMDAMGMFSLATQIIGIDKAFILERIRLKLGKNVVELINRVEAAGEKLLEPVRILLNDGIGALWEWVKKEVSAKLDEIFTKIKEEIFQAIIIKAIAWVASLFIPGLGFIKLIQAIYKALRWLVDNIARLEEMVNAFLGSVELAVQGNVSGIVKNVIKGLTLGVVIAIDFLAKLVGLGNFADKLHRGLQLLRKPIEKVIDWLLLKAKPVVRKIEAAIRKAVKKVKAGAKKVKDKVLAWWKARKKFKGDDGASHELYFKGEAGNADLIVESKPRTVPVFLKEVKKEIDEMPASQKENKKKAQGNWTKAETLDKDIQDLQSKLVKANTGNATDKAVQANQELYSKLQGKLEQLATVLAQLMQLSGHEGNPPPPILPPFSNNVRGQSMEAHYLSANNNVPEGQASTEHSGHLGAWEELIDEGTRARDNFVRMHLLHHKLGGKATDSNLTPAKSVVNTDYYNQLEKPALEDSGLLTGKKSPKNKLIWYAVKVDYHSEDDFAENFISSINVKYGYHDADQNWKKGPAVGTWGAKPGVPDHENKKYIVNEDGRTTLKKMKFKQKKFNETFIDLVVLERTESLPAGTKKLYGSAKDLNDRLLTRITKEGWANTLKGETGRLSAALVDTTSNILLNG